MSFYRHVALDFNSLTNAHPLSHDLSASYRLRLSTTSGGTTTTLASSNAMHMADGGSVLPFHFMVEVRVHVTPRGKSLWSARPLDIQLVECRTKHTLDAEKERVICKYRIDIANTVLEGPTSFEIEDGGSNNIINSPNNNNSNSLLRVIPATSWCELAEVAQDHQIDEKFTALDLRCVAGAGPILVLRALELPANLSLSLGALLGDLDVSGGASSPRGLNSSANLFGGNPNVVGVGAAADYLGLIQGIYERNKPESVPYVSQLLGLFVGEEDRLYRKLRAKYEPETTKSCLSDSQQQQEQVMMTRSSATINPLDDTRSSHTAASTLSGTTHNNDNDSKAATTTTSPMLFGVMARGATVESPTAAESVPSRVWLGSLASSVFTPHPSSPAAIATPTTSSPQKKVAVVVVNEPDEESTRTEEVKQLCSAQREGNVDLDDDNDYGDGEKYDVELLGLLRRVQAAKVALEKTVITPPSKRKADPHTSASNSSVGASDGFVDRYPRLTYGFLPRKTFHVN
eukprot:PhM_4_TR4201/c0_g1_i1/m.16885